MNNLNITSVQVRLVHDHPQIQASASLVIDDSIRIRKIAVIKKSDGTHFVSWPSEKLKNGNYVGICFPVDESVRIGVEKIILDNFYSQLNLDAEKTDI